MSAFRWVLLLLVGCALSVDAASATQSQSQGAVVTEIATLAIDADPATEAKLGRRLTEAVDAEIADLAVDAASAGRRRRRLYSNTFNNDRRRRTTFFTSARRRRTMFFSNARRRRTFLNARRRRTFFNATANPTAYPTPFPTPACKQGFFGTPDTPATNPLYKSAVNMRWIMG
jgi:hypothetical protein